MEMTASEKLPVGLWKLVGQDTNFCWTALYRVNVSAWRHGSKTEQAWCLAGRSSWNSEMEQTSLMLGRELRYLKFLHNYREVRSKPQVSKHILKEMHQSWWNNLDCCSNLITPIVAIPRSGAWEPMKGGRRSPELSVVFKENPIQPKRSYMNPSVSDSKSFVGRKFQNPTWITRYTQFVTWAWQTHNGLQGEQPTWMTCLWIYKKLFTNAETYWGFLPISSV